MTAKTFSQLLVDLDVLASNGRPRVSNDNPYSESHFKTVKYALAYHHEPRAMEVVLLFGMLAFYDLLRVFYDRNRKSAVRARLSRLTTCDEIAACLRALPRGPSPLSEPTCDAGSQASPWPGSSCRHTPFARARSAPKGPRQPPYAPLSARANLMAR